MPENVNSGDIVARQQEVQLNQTLICDSNLPCVQDEVRDKLPRLSRNGNKESYSLPTEDNNTEENGNPNNDFIGVERITTKRFYLGGVKQGANAEKIKAYI